MPTMRYASMRWAFPHTYGESPREAPLVQTIAEGRVPGLGYPKYQGFPSSSIQANRRLSERTDRPFPKEIPHVFKRLFSVFIRLFGLFGSTPTKGKGTRPDGTNHYQNELSNKTNGFRVQKGPDGEKRIKYPTKEGHVTKTFK